MSEPRIITRMVTRLRTLANLMETGEAHPSTPAELREWADELDKYDARETRLDPSERANPDATGDGA